MNNKSQTKVLIFVIFTFMVFSLATVTLLGHYGITGYAVANDVGTYSGTAELQATPINTQSGGTTYYVDSITGSDSNNGLSTSTPWKTLNKIRLYSTTPGFVPGDSILFRRGSVWSEELDFTSSGNANNKITLGAYDSGAMPLFNGRSELINWNNSSSWTEITPNIWLFPTTQHIKRLKLNDIEYEFTQNYNQVSNTVKWNYDTNTYSNLYIYSIGNPATTYNNMTVLSDSSFPAVLYLQGVNNIIVENLNITGGYQESIYIAYSNNITLKNMATGYDSSRGLACKGSDNPNYLTSSDNIVDNVIIDSGYHLHNSDKDGNVEDGVNLNCGCHHWTIQNSEFFDWGHSAIYPLCISTNYAIGASYNTFKNNYFDDSHLFYGRAYNVDGYEGTASYNNFSNNTIKNTWATNQMNGDHNIFEYNIVDTMINSPRETSETGIGLQIVVYGTNLVAHDNIVDHNTFINLDGPGVQIHWYAVGPTYNNIVSNNIFINNGKIGKYDNEANVSLFVYNNAQVYNNIFKNNIIYQSNNNKIVARYRDTNMNATKFITSSLSNGDSSTNHLWINPQLDGDYVPQNSVVCTFEDGQNFVGARPCVNQPPIDNQSNVSVNTPPVINSISLTNSSNTLTCIVSASDYDNDSLTITTEYYNNSILYTTTNNPITVGQSGSWYCKARAYDGTNYSGWSTSNTITYPNITVNIPPVITSIALTNISNTAYCNVAIADNGSVNTSVEYYKDSTLYAQSNYSTKNINYSITITNGSWYCRARAYDGQNYSNWNTSNTITYATQSNPPVNTLPVINSITLTNSSNTLTCVVSASDFDNDSLIITTEYYNNSVLYTTTNNPITVGQSGSWYCKARAYDGTNYSGWSTSNTITFPNITVNIPPVITSIALTNISSTAYCNVAITDNTSVNTSVEYYKDSTLYAENNFTTKNINYSINISNGSWYCRARAYDGQNYSTWNNSNTITYATQSNQSNVSVNIPPVITSIALTNISSTAYCLVAVSDNGSVNTSVEYYKDSILYSQNNFTTKNINYSISISNGSWYCRARAYDGQNYSNWNTSNTITYATQSNQSNQSTSVTLLGPDNALDSTSTVQTLQYMVSGVYSSYNCNTTINNVVNDSRIVNNNSMNNLTITLDLGSYIWSVVCNNTYSVNRTFTISAPIVVPPVVVSSGGGGSSTPVPEPIISSNITSAKSASANTKEVDTNNISNTTENNDKLAIVVKDSSNQPIIEEPKALQTIEKVANKNKYVYYFAIILFVLLSVFIVNNFKSLETDDKLSKYIRGALYAGYSFNAIRISLKGKYKEIVIDHHFEIARHLGLRPIIRHNKVLTGRLPINSDQLVQQLRLYIKVQESQGFKRSDIKQVLLHYGHNKHVVEDAIAS